MSRHAVRSAVESLVRASVVCLLLLPSCGDDARPGDGGDAEDVYVRCNEEMCTSGNLVCCLGAEPGTWDPMRMGCVCPTHADADADGDGEVAPDAAPDGVADGEPDATPDGAPDGEPDAMPDGAPDAAPDSTLDSAAD